MKTMLKFVYRFYCDEDAPTFLEYGLLISLIAAAAAVGIAVFGNELALLFDNARNSFP